LTANLPRDRSGGYDVICEKATRPAEAVMEQLKQLFRSVVENAGQPLLEARHEEQIRQLLEAAGRDDPAKVKSAAIACAEELAGAQPAEVRERFIGDLIRLLDSGTTNPTKPVPPALNKLEERLERFVRTGQTGALSWLLARRWPSADSSNT
jgi:hypothetical protein